MPGKRPNASKKWQKTLTLSPKRRKEMKGIVISSGK
jgi:hypothetical protein